MIVSICLITSITLVCSLILTRLAMRIAIRFNVGDVPSPRKIHKVFVPYLGGIAILISVMIGIVLTFIIFPDLMGTIPKYYYFIASGCLFISLVGLYDDLKKLSFSKKFLAQVIAAVFVVLGGFQITTLSLPVVGHIHLGLFSYLFTIFWIVFVTNALNLLDGLDGLASGVSTIIFISFAIISFQAGNTLFAVIAVVFIAANLGFLRYNFHPASIFMGDAGSLFLGFSISILSLEAVKLPGTHTVYFIIPLTIMAVPILDTTISFFRRTGKKMHPFVADKDHVHHRLMTIGFSHPNAVKIIYFFSIVSGLMGLSFLWLNESGIVTVFIVAAIMSALLIRRLGYIEIEKNLIIVGNGDNNGNGKLNGLLNGINGNGRKEKKFIPFDLSQFVQSFLFLLSDVIFVIAAFLVVYFLWLTPKLPLDKLLSFGEIAIWVAWSVIFWSLLLSLNDMYRMEWDTSRIDEIFTVLKIVAFGTLLLFFLSFELKIPFLISHRVFILYGIALIFGVGLGRLLLITILKKREILEFKRRPTVIVGASQRAIKIVNRIKSLPVLKFNLQGFIDERSNGRIGTKIQGLPVLGGYEDIPAIVKKRKIREVIIALDDSDREEIFGLIALFNQYDVSVKLVPDFYNLLSGFKTSHIYGVSLIRFFESNMKTWEWLLKRFTDIVISLIVLIAFLPIWIIISAIIVLGTKGPIFYKQKRVGRNKQPFDVIKFRSMVKDAEELTGPKWAEKDDPRITSFGRFLRKAGLDEVPQFVNVFLGHMSIVGPRPERPYFVNDLEQSIKFYSRRLIVKPGITGWAQIKHKYDESIDDVREKLRYDLYYIENMSILLDLKIITQTILVGLRRGPKPLHKLSTFD